MLQKKKKFTENCRHFVFVLTLGLHSCSIIGTGAVFTFTKVIVLFVFFKKMSLLDDCDAEVVRSPTKCETGARSFEIERESGGIKWRKTTIASGDYVADTATRYNMQIFI